MIHEIHPQYFEVEDSGQFMAEKTLFQKILSGEIPGNFIARGDNWASFLDVFPRAPGHTLVVPHSPVQRIADLSDNEITHLFEGVKQTQSILSSFFETEDTYSNSKSTGLNNLDRTLYILYAGNIGEGQGLHKILPEMSLTLKQDAVFTIVGNGSGLQALKKQIEDSNIKNIIIHPPVPRIQLVEFYSKADILFLHLNDYDAFKKVLPSKIFEYAATGLPILAGVDGYAKSFLEENVENSRIFTPCDAKKAVNEMYKLNLSFTKRKCFKKEFSRRKTSERLVSEVTELLYKDNN